MRPYARGMTTRRARPYNDVNVLRLGADITGPDVVLDRLQVFLMINSFSARYAERSKKLMTYEEL